MPACLLFPLERQRWVREWRLASGSATLCGVHIDYTCHWRLARAVYSDSWQHRARWITAPARLWPATSSLGFIEGVWKARCFFFSFLFFISLFFVTGRVWVYLSTVTCCSSLVRFYFDFCHGIQRMLAGYILSVFKGALCSVREILNLNTYDIDEVITQTFFP